MASSTGKFINPVGFDRTFSMKDRPCIAVFAPGYTGKTRFAVTAGEWAASRGTVPGWIICDRKTRQTVEATCTELGIDPPLMSKSDYISAGAALKLANSDDEETTKKVYTEAFNKITEDIIALASNDLVDPIIVDSGTELWEWIGYARLGRREGVKARYWGPAKRDWKDLFEAVKHKTVIITFWARSEFKDDKMTGKTMLDGPPHYSYTTTTIVRLRKEEKAKTDAEKYLLDVTESIDNKAVEFEEGLLTGESITFANLMAILRPED